MATGRNMQLTKQIGESLAVAELGRHKYIATSFSGNVPDIDILACSPSGKSFSVQVKAIQGGSWQFDIRRFLDVELAGKTQIVNGKTALGITDLICVFIQVGASGKEDQYYVFHWSVLQDYFFDQYKGGVRSRNPESFHCALRPINLENHRDKWDILPK
jgi:hypothetical protein